LYGIVLQVLFVLLLALFLIQLLMEMAYNQIKRRRPQARFVLLIERLRDYLKARGRQRRIDELGRMKRHLAAKEAAKPSDPLAFGKNLGMTPEQLSEKLRRLREKLRNPDIRD
jgi:hypothetical protein